MAKFNQLKQQVVNQVNAQTVNVVNFGSVQNKEELIVELQKLLTEVNKATKAGIIQEDVSVDIESHIKKAVIEAEKPEPKKESILDHIDGAKSLLEGIASAAGLVTALIQAAKIVGNLFL